MKIKKGRRTERTGGTERVRGIQRVRGKRERRANKGAEEGGDRGAGEENRVSQEGEDRCMWLKSCNTAMEMQL